MKKCFYCVMLGLLLIPNLCIAGPFGTEMGDTQEKYIALGVDPVYNRNDEYIMTTNMPAKHSLLTEYSLSFGETGLYEVVGKCEGFEASKENFDVIFSQLQKKYGKVQIRDLSGVRIGVTYFDATWKNVNKDNIYEIVLKQYYDRSFSSKPHLILIYTYKNKKEADDEKEKADINAL